MPLLAARAPQIAELGHAALIAFAPRGDAIAHPIELHRDFAIELVRVAFFLREHLIAPRLVTGKSAIQAPRKSAVEPKRGAREIFQKTPVMADQDQRRAQGLKLFLQPLDRGQIEMIGRLVQQQDIRRRGEHAGKGGAARFSARQTVRRFRPIQAELAKQIIGPVRIIAGGETGFDIGARVGKARQRRFLRQIANRCARLNEARPPLGIHEAGGDLEKGGLARAVSPDQAQPFAFAHGQLSPVQDRGAAEIQMNVLEKKNGCGHRASS